MARKTIVTYVSDLSGAPGATPHVLVIDGKTYEIDLTADEWKSITTPIISVARRVPQRTKAPRTRPTSTLEAKDGLRVPAVHGTLDVITQPEVI
jgi:hypothetical protein